MIGIIVIGRNEGERLVACLDSLDREKCRIVYVDSASTDRSVANATARGAIVVELDMSVGFTAARARNAGLAALRESGFAGPYAQFIDGDCVLDPQWLSVAADYLDRHPETAVVCGRRKERHPEASVYNWLCDREWDTPVGPSLYCGGDALMRLSALDAVEGYDAGLMAGEEPELCTRLRAAGWAIYRLDAPMTVHDAAMTRLGQWWLRSVRGGYGYAQVWDRTRGRPVRFFGRQLIRLAIWGIALPLAILATVLIWPLAALVLASLYALQTVRQAGREGWSRNGWVSAFFMLLSKFPEAQGALRYWRRRARGGATVSAITYK